MEFESQTKDQNEKIIVKDNIVLGEEVKIEIQNKEEPEKEKKEEEHIIKDEKGNEPKNEETKNINLGINTEEIAFSSNIDLDNGNVQEGENKVILKNRPHQKIEIGTNKGELIIEGEKNEKDNENANKKEGDIEGVKLNGDKNEISYEIKLKEGNVPLENDNKIIGITKTEIELGEKGENESKDELKAVKDGNIEIKDNKDENKEGKIEIKEGDNNNNRK